MLRRQFLCALAAASGTGAAPQKIREYHRGGMVYRSLGATGLDVSLLAFGSHTDPADRVRAGPEKTVLTPAGQARRDRLIARAFDAGVNLLDVYESEGQWEPAARLVKDRRDRVLISLAHETRRLDLERAFRMFGHVDLYRFHTADIDGPTLENWDMLRKAKEAGHIRAIGIATHIERTMNRALDELDDLDYIFFPYNFIHARANYGEFLPRAAAKGVGLIAMKPLASGSIVKLDPRAKPKSGPEFDTLQLWQTHNRPVLPAAVAELTRALQRLPEESLCMAALRFNFSRPFLSTSIAGIFDEQWLAEDLKALSRYEQFGAVEQSALDTVRQVSGLLDGRWLPAGYRWLEEQWRG